MYKKVYRQEGGLAEEGYLAQIREAARKKIEEFNRRNKGEVAQRVRTPVRKPSIPQRIKKGISSLVPLIQNNPMAKLAQQAINAPEIAQLESEYGPGYTGKPSDARHQAAANEISKSVSNLIDKGSFGLVPEKFRDFVGDIVPNLGGGIKELGSLVYNIAPNRFGVPSPMPPKEALDMAIEDVKANYEGSFGTDNTKTAREIYEDVYREQPLTREEQKNQFEQNLPEGYRPLNVTYDAYWDGYGTKPYDDILKERIETRKGSYSGMPVILSPKNADFFQQYFQGPLTQLHTRPEDRAAKIAEMEDYYKSYPDTFWNQYQEQQQANAFQPIATPISMQNEQQTTGFQKVNDINNAFQKVNNEVLKPVQEQQQGLPSLMKIVDEQQNPTPVDPDAPYGYVEYTPPFYGGMAIPPGGFKPIRVPADQYGNPIKPGLKAI